MNVEKLKRLFEQCPDKYRAAKEMGATYPAIYNIINKGASPKVNLLENIARYFKVPVGYFFDEDTTISADVSLLSEELAKKNAQIDRLLGIIEAMQGVSKKGIA